MRGWTMTNSSSLSKALVLAGAAAALTAASAASGFAAPALGALWPAVASVSAAAAAGAAVWYLVKLNRELRATAQICSRAAIGDLEARILGLHEGGSVGALQHGINNMLDIVDAFVRESGASMDYVSHGKYFRKVLVRGLPGAFRSSATVINAATESMHRKVHDFNQFAETIAKNVGLVIDTISTTTSQLQTNAESLSATAKDVTTKSMAVAAASEEVTVNVQTVSAATEELSSSIGEIGRQVSESTKVAESAVVEAENTNQTMKGLVEAVAKIGEVINLINDIASQTNLLALNATIEAARAGEAGKGFSVVASEVKTLANQTAKATDDIAAQIGAIQAATNNAVAAIESVGKTIGRIDEIATSIASAIEEQGAATQEIARNVQQAATGTRDVAANIAQISEAAGQASEAAVSVSNATGGLSRGADNLRNEIEKFLAGIKAA